MKINTLLQAMKRQLKYSEKINKLAKNKIGKIINNMKYELDNKNKIIGEISNKFFIDFFEDLDDVLKEYKDTHKRFSTIMLRLGWPPQNDLYTSDLTKIVKAYDEFGLEEIKNDVDSYFLKRYSKEKLYEMLDLWRSEALLEKRLPIIKEAINAHISGNYYLSISALLPQIEGVIADGFGHHGIMYRGNLEKYIKRLNKKRNPFNNFLKNFYINILLARFKHGVIPDSILSRHAIVHGGDVNYGTKLNSVKTILLFDFILDIFNFVSIEGKNKYHRYDCKKIKNKRNLDWQPYKNEKEAKEDNKLPCDLCINKG